MRFFNGKSDDGEDKKNIRERLEEQLDKLEERVSNIEYELEIEPEEEEDLEDEDESEDDK